MKDDIETVKYNILERFGINADCWLHHVKFFNLNYSFCVGKVDRMRSFVDIFDRRLGKGVSASSRCYQ